MRDVVSAGVREGAIPAYKAEILPLVITGIIKSIAVHRIRDGGEMAGDADAIVDLVLDGVRGSAR